MLFIKRRAMKSRYLGCSFLALVLVSSGALSETVLNISLGYETTSGDYGLGRDTDITTLPVDVQLIENAWRFRLSVPFISVTGDGSVVPGAGGVVSSGSMQGAQIGAGSGGPVTVQPVSIVMEETHSGLGDIITSASYAFYPDDVSGVFSELTAEIKWGTASASKNLGTGENDYSLSLYTLYDEHRIQPFMTLGYLFIGDTSSIDYNDVWFVTPGLMLQLNPDTAISLAYEYEQATIEGADSGRTVSLYANTRFSEQWAAGFYVLFGLSDSVADSGVGFNISRDF